MNLQDLREAIWSCLEQRDQGYKVENPFSEFFYSETGESKGEKLSFIDSMYQTILKELEEEREAIAGQRAEVDSRMSQVNEEFHSSMIESAHIDSILEKINDLKNLHSDTISQAMHLYPLSVSDQQMLLSLDRKAEELNANLDNVRKDILEVRANMEVSREELEEKIEQYEDKKSQEENKLELLVVIQNVVRKKREQIVERNATLVGLKRESEEMEVTAAKLERTEQSRSADERSDETDRRVPGHFASSERTAERAGEGDERPQQRDGALGARRGEPTARTRRDRPLRD